MKMRKEKKNSLMFFRRGVDIFRRGFSFLFSKKKRGLRGLVQAEENEAKNFLSHREGWSLFFRHSKSILIQYFVPTIYNGYKPRILRTKSLLSVTVFVLLVKISFLSYLFLSHPDLAEMSGDIHQEIFLLINESRKEEGLEGLSIDPALSAAAQAKARDMIASGYFSHTGPDGKRPWEWIARDDYDYVFVGENLAMNFFTAESAHRALMNSESHRKNIMGGKYVDVGLAVAHGIIDGQETNILVEIFGTKRETDFARSFDVRTAGTTDKGDEDFYRSGQLIVSDVVNPDFARGNIIPNSDIEYGRSGSIKTLGSEYDDARVGAIFYKILLLVAAIIFIISLFIKLVVNSHIQHKGVILRSILLLFFIFSIFYFKFHQLEGGSAGLLIL